MQQSVQNGRDDDQIVEQFCPIGECLVRCNYRAGLFITVGNEPEEQVTFFKADGGIPHLINNNQRGFIIAATFDGEQYQRLASFCCDIKSLSNIKAGMFLPT